MYRPLVPCPSCARHVLASETACPFCAAALPEDLAEHVPAAAPRRLNRAAAFVFGATIAVTACSSEVTGDSSASSGGGNGGAGGNSGTGGAGGAADAGPDDDGSVMPLYGDPPPLDAGEDVAPPPTDAGDGGGGFPLYGAPPKP